jgi:hypothetical protein
LEEFSHLLTKHNLGGKFHLAFILEQLSKLGLDFKDTNEMTKKAIGGAFVERLFCFFMDHSLRGVKFKARIPVPKSYIGFWYDLWCISSSVRSRVTFMQTATSSLCAREGE